jgi:hypothetical protein
MRLFAALCIIIAGLAALPGVSSAADAKALLTEANTLFRSADKDFMSGKMDSAWETVIKAKEAVAAAKAADPSSSQTASLEKRIDQLAAKIEKRRGNSSQAAPAGKPTSPSGAPKRLPATAGRYLMEADRALKRAETLLGPDREKQDPARLPAQLREILAPAEENLGKLLAEFPEFSGHPDVTPKVERLEAARKELETLEGAASVSKGAEEAARAESEAESGKWLKKLRPFVASKSNMNDAPFLDPEKEMVSYAGFDIGAEELARRHRIHGEAAAALEEYRKAGVKEPWNSSPKRRRKSSGGWAIFRQAWKASEERPWTRRSPSSNGAGPSLPKISRRPSGARISIFFPGMCFWGFEIPSTRPPSSFRRTIPALPGPGRTMPGWMRKEPFSGRSVWKKYA